MSDERFDLVDVNGKVVGAALRSEVHGNPDLLHQAVHVFVLRRDGRLFLQKRAMAKDVQPGKWDTSVGGHVDLGEDAIDAAHREMREELGIEGDLRYAYTYLWRSEIESELIRSYVCHHEGPFILHPAEIDEGRFWTPDEIEAQLGQGIFTPNFEQEWPRMNAWLRP